MRIANLLIVTTAVLLTGPAARLPAQENLAVWQRPQQQPPAAPPPANLPLHECPTLEELGYQVRGLADISLNIATGDRRVPADCSRDLFTAAPAAAAGQPRGWYASEFTWAASELYHQPLYFEDALLERYGQSHHPLLQPWLSGAHFFGTFPLIPYKIGLDRTHDRVYTLGHYRPGSPTPRLARRLPPELDAAFFESGAWVALVLLLP